MTPQEFAEKLIGADQTATQQTLRLLIIDAILQWEAQKASEVTK